MEKDRRARLGIQERLRLLRRNHSGRVEIFCSHDVREFERLAGHPEELPASPATAASTMDDVQPARS
jgi:hypothetical protein